MKNKCLLIWPPLVYSPRLPLGISFLIAYAKSKGVTDIEAFDLNIAYQKKLRLYWCLYTFVSSYRAFVGRVSNILSRSDRRAIKNSGTNSEHAKAAHSPAAGERHFLIEKAARLYKAFNWKMAGWLTESIVKIDERIPWALESIIGSFLSPGNSAEMKKVEQILRGVLKKNKFSMIGISALYPKQLFFALMTAAAVKKIDKNIKVVIGGAQITKHIAQIINNSVKIYDLVDFLVAGDGEETLLNLLEKSSADNLLDVPNLYFKSKDIPNKYIATQKTFCLQPKDFPVPDFQDFHLSSYEDWMPILVSKGCWWSRCSFCTYASMRDHAYHATTADNAIRIIKSLKETYKTSKFVFVDDALPAGFLKELAEKLIKERIKIDWRANIILTRDFNNPDFCKLLRAAGLTAVFIGLESISPRILKLMNKYHKDMSESEITEILRTIKHANIHAKLYVLFGFPTETLAEARQTLDFLIKNRALYESFHPQAFSLEQGTPVFANPGEFGISRIHTSDKNYGMRLGYYFEVVEGMSPEQARKFVSEEVMRGVKM